MVRPSVEIRSSKYGGLGGGGRKPADQKSFNESADERNTVRDDGASAESSSIASGHVHLSSPDNAAAASSVVVTSDLTLIVDSNRNCGRQTCGKEKKKKNSTL